MALTCVDAAHGCVHALCNRRMYLRSLRQQLFPIAVDFCDQADLKEFVYNISPVLEINVIKYSRSCEILLQVSRCRRTVRAPFPCNDYHCVYEWLPQLRGSGLWLVGVACLVRARVRGLAKSAAKRARQRGQGQGSCIRRPAPAGSAGGRHRPARCAHPGRNRPAAAAAGCPPHDHRRPPSGRGPAQRWPAGVPGRRSRRAGAG